MSTNIIAGHVFGRLTTVSREVRGRRAFWLCRCECGRTTTVRADCLTDGNTRSCGCLKVERATLHGHSCSRADKPPSPTYVTWQSMVGRCTKPDYAHYDRYGGAGVRVCERWLTFANFLADMGERPDGCSIDRINSSGDYEPGNCRWASPKQQARNRRNNRLLTIDGETRCVAEWAEIHGIPRTVVQDRLRLGWGAERAVRAPYLKRASKS